MNFFDPLCQEKARTDSEFGLCDDQDGTRAYSTTTDPHTWIAQVMNNNNRHLVFTAIDKCVIQDQEEIGRGRCDGMLTSDDLLYLVELKNAAPPWQSLAVEQLASTIRFLKQYHNIDRFRFKKAFACNKQRNKFQIIDNETNLKFFREHGFRLDIQAEIIVV